MFRVLRLVKLFSKFCYWGCKFGGAKLGRCRNKCASFSGMRRVAKIELMFDVGFSTGES